MDRPAHYRRCHVCDHINVINTHPVLKCAGCNRSLAPFYYFDDRLTPIPSEGTERPPHIKSEYHPIQGLTVYWENF